MHEPHHWCSAIPPLARCESDYRIYACPPVTFQGQVRNYRRYTSYETHNTLISLKGEGEGNRSEHRQRLVPGGHENMDAKKVSGCKKQNDSSAMINGKSIKQGVGNPRLEKVPQQVAHRHSYIR